MSQKEAALTAMERLETVRRHGLFSAYKSGGRFSDDIGLTLWLARKGLGSGRILDAKIPATLWDAEQTIAELREALKPFADLSDWIAKNRPDYDGDAHEVQIEGWPYTLSVGWLRRAAKVAASADTHPKGGDAKQAPFMSGAVPPEEAGDAQTPSGPSHD